MGEWSIWHWLVVLLIVLLVFGAGKLKNIGPDLGSAVREFKKAMHGHDGEDKPAAGDKAENRKAGDAENADADASGDTSRKRDQSGS